MSLERQTFAAGQQSFECYMFTVTSDDGEQEIWFKAKDIATFLDYTDTYQAIRTHVDDEWKMCWDELAKRLVGGADIELPTYWKPNTIFVAEPGLYGLISRSKKEEAKKFTKWVFSDVLPSIRKRGFYALNQETQQRLEAEFKKREIEIRNQAAIEARAQLAIEYENKLSMKDEELETHKAEIATHKAELETHKAELTARNAELATHKAELANKDAVIARNERVIEQAKEIIRDSAAPVVSGGQNPRVDPGNPESSLAAADNDPMIINKPRNTHQLSVFYRPATNEPFCSQEYAFSRTKIQNAKRSIEKIMRDSCYERVNLYYQEQPAHATNVPNKIKSYLMRNGQYKRVRGNCIKSTVRPEKMIELLKQLEKK